MEYLVYKGEIDPNIDSDLEVNFIGLVEMPAIERNFQAFNEQKERAKFAINEDKRIISGPAMIAGLPIYRNDPRNGEYYVMFDKAAIETISEKFNAKGYLKNFNLFHDDAMQLDSVVIRNSWISDVELGIKPPSGFEDLPDGTWFITAKVNDDATWARVKSGEVKGFSVEGVFNYTPVGKVQMTAEQFFQQLHDSLSPEARKSFAKILNETTF